MQQPLTENNVVRLQNKGMRVADNLMRFFWGRSFGYFWMKRDYDKVFGWDPIITPQMIYRMYTRNGVAKRIVNAYPEEIWGHPPTVTVTQQWTKAFNDIVKQFNLWDVFKRWDTLARMGRYGVLLVGTDAPNLEAPLQRANKITYLQPYSEMSAMITRWNTDPQDPGFGQPLEYTIYPDLLEIQNRPPMLSSIGFPTRKSFRVHASRIIHLSPDSLEDGIFSTPMLTPAWNYLLDLMKITGGSAESYWMTANRGMQLDVDKDMDLDDDDEAALTQEAEEYENGMRRIIRTRGVTVRDLGARVADPRGPFGVTMSLIGGTYGMPQRILLGSEAGHLASTQDRMAWANQVEIERELTSEPKVLFAFINWCEKVGIMPASKPNKRMVEWPDAYRAAPLERSQTANQIGTAAANLAMAMSKVENFISPENARRIIGSPSDNQIYEGQDPDEFSGSKPTIVQPPAAPAQGGAKKTTKGGGNTSGANPGTDSNGGGSPNVGDGKA
jgi:hypothetical protein